MPKRKNSIFHPEISIHNFPFGKYYNAGPNNNNGWQDVHNIILQSIGKLKSIGADFIIIPANTVHFNFDYLKNKSPLPIISIVDAVVSESVRLNFREVAVLGTQFTIKGKLYDNVFKKSNIRVAKISSNDCHLLQNIIMDDLIPNKINVNTINRFMEIAARIKCDSIVLACTELPLLIPHLNIDKPMIDTTRLLARKALEFSLNEVK